MKSIFNGDKTISPAWLLKKTIMDIKTFIQHLVITMGFFGKNGLTNHAAAGAYGFLLSAAPMILIVSFFLIRAFRTTPEAAISLLNEIPFLDFAIDEDWPALEFLIYAPAGIPTLVTMLSIFWAGRIFAVSMQRGIKIVFTGTKKRNPVEENLVTLAIELVILVVMLAVILGSGLAVRLYDAAGFIQGTLLSRLLVSLSGSRTFSLAALGFLMFLVYRFIPVNPPRKAAALWGSIFCIVSYGTLTLLMDTLLRQPRYNFLHGALGDIVIVLVGVYFFFLCFFLGCQFAAVSNSFDALLFLRLRETRSTAAENAKGLGPLITRRLFYHPDGKLKKYHRLYREGDIIMSQGEKGNDVYYLLEGEADALLPSRCGSGVSESDASGSVAPADAYRVAGILKTGSFIGEMNYLLSEGRSATIRARTAVSALALPPCLFGEILGNDTELDKSIIENLSRRVKKGNEQIAALSDSGATISSQ